MCTYYCFILAKKKRMKERKKESKRKEKKQKEKKKVSNVPGRDGAWRGTERSEVGISSPLCLCLD